MNWVGIRSWTLKAKIRLALFMVSFMPFVLVVVYLQKTGKARIIDDAVKQYSVQTHQVASSVSAGISMYATDMHGDLVAQSGTKPIPKHRMEVIIKHLNNARVLYRDFFFMDTKLYLFAPIYTTMQKNTPVGNLLLSYDLTRLLRFTPESVEGTFLFYFPNTGLYIGRKQNKDTILPVLHTKHAYIGKKFIMVKERLGSVLSEGWVIESVQTSYALAFIERFMLFVWLILFAGTIVILLVSWWIGNTRVAVYPESEMQMLATHFNTLLETVNNSMQALEEESRLRLARFVRLITIFNELIQTQTHEACIDVVTKEVDSFVAGEHFYFSSEEITDEATQIPLYVADHTSNTRRYYGKFVCSGDGSALEENELRFYRAVASMVTLQMDRIEMIRQISAVSEAKSAFISYLSHELRTPLHAILGTTQYLIGYESLTQQQQEKVGKIETSAGHLLGMINAMLDLAQIEAGKVEVDPTMCNTDDIDRIMGEAVDITEVLAEQKALVLKKETRSSIPRMAL